MVFSFTAMSNCFNQCLYIMNEEDIKQFLNAYEDFMKHSEVEIDSYLKWQEARSYTNTYYQQKAQELNVNIDYYLQEFV